MSKNTIKNAPVSKQGRKNTRYHSALHQPHSRCLIDFAANLPEKPERCNGRTRCTYCPFSTLLAEWTSHRMWRLPCTNRQFSGVFLLVTLSAQTHLSFWNYVDMIAGECPSVKCFCPRIDNFFKISPTQPIAHSKIPFRSIQGMFPLKLPKFSYFWRKSNKSRPKNTK